MPIVFTKPRRTKMVKCKSSAHCQRRSRDPKADGWIWVQSTIPHWNDWRSPECIENLQSLVGVLGGETKTEPLN